LNFKFPPKTVASDLGQHLVKKKVSKLAGDDVRDVLLKIFSRLKSTSSTGVASLGQGARAMVRPASQSGISESARVSYILAAAAAPDASCSTERHKEEDVPAIHLSLTRPGEAGRKYKATNTSHRRCSSGCAAPG
ncbi:hypothetical protein K0M31_014238, partial [Melipona bicolor]